MDTITIIQESQPTKKVDISLRQLIDIDETGGIRAEVDKAEGKITNNQVLTAYAEKIDPNGTLGKVKSFRFKNLSSIITGGTGITVTTDKDGITTISAGGYVPYVGATTNVDLGEFELKAGQLSLDISPTGTASVGTTRWNNTIGSSETTLKGGSVILKNGVDLVARVVNKVTPNTTLTKAAYQAVRVSGAAGQRLAVEFAQADNDANSADTIGLVTETIATNQEGFIMTVGNLEEINTTGSLQGETWADGDVLYLSPTTEGALTNIKPTGATGHIVVMGYVEYAHAIHGKIYVKIMNGWELDELHNVYISSPANNEVLTYESATSLWKNKAISAASTVYVFNMNSYAVPNNSLFYGVYLGGTPVNPAVVATQYGGAATAFFPGYPMPAGTASTLVVILRAAQVAPTSTVTLKLANTSTSTFGPVVTIAAGSAAGTYTDNSATVSFTTNQILTIVASNPFIAGATSSGTLSTGSFKYTL